MSKRDLISSFVAGVILSLIALGVFFSGNGALFSFSAKAQTDVDSIRQLMLISHKNWSSLKGEAVTTWYLSDNKTQVVTSEFAIKNPDKSRFEMPSTGSLWISNGKNIFEINENDLTYIKLDQPDIEGAISSLPTNLDDTQNEITRYPLAMWTISPIADYIYPTGLAQRAGEYKLLKEDILLGRKVWEISYQLESDLGEITMNAKYWVDQELGVILKAEVYSTEADTVGKVIEETVFQRIEINPEIPDGTFAQSLDGYKEVEPDRGN